MIHQFRATCIAAFFTAVLTATSSAQFVSSEFIYEEAPFPQCHASTLAEVTDGLVAAWFGGTEEGDKDVEIWLATFKDGTWSSPRSVANGVQEDGERFPCWNPVLFQLDDRMVLYYKVGPNPREWWGMKIESQDDGQTWSLPQALPEGILGPIKNKPVLLSSERLLAGSSTEHAGWRVHMEWTDDQGESWQKSSPLNVKDDMESIQPTILLLPDNRLQILCRSKNTRKITTAFSDDGGSTWTKFSTLELPNNNSGLDAVTLADGRHALVYNHLARGRNHLHVAISENGTDWQAVAVLEDEPGQEFSYPAVIQTQDGKIHVTYTWKRRRIKHAVIDPANLQTQPIVDGVWPAEVVKE